MRRKQNLASALGIPKKIGVTMHFSEIIKLQFGIERHTLLCILKLFTNIVDYLPKIRGYPQFSIWILITLVTGARSRNFRQFQH